MSVDSEPDGQRRRDNPLFGGLHRRDIWQRARDLRRPAFLQDADRHKPLHIELGHGRCLLSHRHPLPADHHVLERVDFWAVSVQAVHDQHLHHAIHVVDFPAYHVRRSIHRRLSSHLVAPLQDAISLENCVANGLGNVGTDYAPNHALR